MRLRACGAVRYADRVELRLVACVALLGCGGGSGHPAAKDADAAADALADATADAAPPPCDVTKPFGAPSLVDGVSTSDDDRWGWETADQLAIYFAHAPAGDNNLDLYVATRARTTDAFSGARMLPTSTALSEARPIVSGDGLTLYMEYVTSANVDIDVATRADTASEFSAHTTLPVIDTPKAEFNPWISADNLTLYFTSDRDGFNDIFVATRASASDPFGTPAAVAELNSPQGDYMGALSLDGLEIFIASSRDTNLANDDIFHATRASTADPFGMPTKIAELSSATTNEYPTWVSADRCQLMFTSNRGGGYDVWIATRAP